MTPKIVDTLIKASDKFAYFLGKDNFDSNREKAFELIQFIGDYCEERMNLAAQKWKIDPIERRILEGLVLEGIQEKAKNCKFKDAIPPEVKLCRATVDGNKITVDGNALKDGEEAVIKRSDGTIYFEIRSWS